MMEEIKILRKNEFTLAQQMKEKYCDVRGKETNPEKAAEILHRIGLTYRKRSPDKISLIKSAGLLNAAIVRNPPNVSQIKSDLSELCRHILEQSSANNQTADLIRKSEQVIFLVTKLRNEVKEFLESKIPRISTKSSKASLIKKTTAIQQLNKLITHKYKQFMADLSQYCEQVMGKPPCQYAIVGMGSLAREEITAYSDFEHIILLCDDKNYKSYLEYFRWFSVIFHIVVLNVQETIVPSLNIAGLNGDESTLGDWFYDNVTPRGISFDGMMPHACKFPLGRQQHTKNKQFAAELIKPVSEMLKYLTSGADLKNGYHLADILTRTCFVFGNEGVFKQFADGAQKYRDTKSETDTINDIKNQVKQDLNNFSTRFRLSKLKSLHTINIKQLVYRSTTIFISALARKHNISANSCFDIIDEMADHNQITQNTADKLKFAIAIACEMRLRVYTDQNSQCDNAIDLQQDGIKKFLDVVGVTCTINYFQIAYCLQCEVAKQLNFTKLHFYTDPQLINITIGLAFGMKTLPNISQNFEKQIWNSSKFDFDACIEQLESKMSLNDINNFSNQTDLVPQQIKYLAEYLNSAKIFDEALEFYKQLLDIYENNSKDNNCDYDVAWANHQIGSCLTYRNDQAEALSYSRRALEIREKLSLDVERDRDVAETFHTLGKCNIILHNYDEALTDLNRALEIYQNTTLNADADRDVAATLHNISVCHLHLHNCDEALTILNRALKVKHKASQNVDTDRDVAVTLHNIGWCHIDLQNYDKALTNLNQALEIFQNTSLDIVKELWLAHTQSEIGRCRTGLQQYNDSWSCLQQSLKIYQNITLDEENNIQIARIFNYMGKCLIGKQQYAKALTYLQKAQKIYQTQFNWEKLSFFATTLNDMGICLMELQKHTEALNSFKKSLDIYKKLPSNEHIVSKIESIRYKIEELNELNEVK